MNVTLLSPRIQILNRDVVGRRCCSSTLWMFGASTTVALTERSSDWFDRFGRPYGPQYALISFLPLNGMPTTVQGTEWPSHGEIDIIEGVNLMPNNEYSLHANPGFAVPGNSSQTGKFLTTDCSQGNGCAINETAPNSFGEGFAQNGGGVWAAQFDTSGILWVQSRGFLCRGQRLTVVFVLPPTWVVTAFGSGA